MTAASREELELVFDHSSSRLHRALAAVELADRNGAMDELRDLISEG